MWKGMTSCVRDFMKLQKLHVNMRRQSLC